jgi:hypothetical protein
MMLKFSFKTAFYASSNGFVHGSGDLFARFSVAGQTPPSLYAVPKILAPQNRLKAICRHRISMRFWMILGNLARKASLCRWLKPKYCSTM